MMTYPSLDLDDLKSIEFGVISATSAETFFLRPSNIAFQRNLQRFPNGNELVSALESDSVLAIVRDNVILDYLANQKPCDKFLVGKIFDKSNYAIGLRQGVSSYNLSQVLGLAIVELRESGVLESLYSIWWQEGLCSNQGSKLETDSLDVGDFLGVFAMMGIMCAAGISE